MLIQIQAMSIEYKERPECPVLSVTLKRRSRISTENVP